MSTPTRHGQNAGISSPHTPQRGISSTYSSPGFRTDDDTVIFELGTRYLRAGLVHDSVPRCSLDFGPEQSRRLGDYRKWLPGFEDRPRVVKNLETWTKDHELWQLDVRDTDLGLMLDKLERTIRKAYSEYLLLDAKSRKIVLVVQAMISHTILSRILNLMFVNFQVSSVTLLPPPTMAVVAAGQRSGLVVDIGWHETVVTAVYELREIAELRSTRAMQLLSKEVAKFLEGYIQSKNIDGQLSVKTKLDFEYVEELMTQIFWCRPASQVLSSHDRPIEAEDTNVLIPLPLPSSKGVEIPFSALSGAVESTLLAPSDDSRKQDDHECDLGHLIYRTLLSLAPDVRSMCMPRIVFTGGGSNIQGLKPRLLKELEAIIRERSWNKVWQPVKRTASVATTPRPSTHIDAGDTHTKENPTNAQTGAAFEDQIYDPYEEKIYKVTAQFTKSEIRGEIRGIETMGVFTGASITAALRIKSLVEIERELFLQHGLFGPKREQDSATSRPKSLTGVYTKHSALDTSSWTLGAFA